MFQRFTESARRVIFFARYEASQYGATVIATEHLLLGLMREDRGLHNRLLGPNSARWDLRAEMEKEIQRGERISTSVEIPLSIESKKVLNLAVDEADRLSARHVGTQHLLLGLLGVTGSLAQRTLAARGVKPDDIRRPLAAAPSRDPEPQIVAVRPVESALVTMLAFLEGLNSTPAHALVDFFAADAVFVDSQGKRWERDAIVSSFGALFANYAKKNAAYVAEAPILSTDDTFAVTIIWKNAQLVFTDGKWTHRMGIVWTRQEEDWKIGFAQVTPVSN